MNFIEIVLKIGIGKFMKQSNEIFCSNNGAKYSNANEVNFGKMGLDKNGHLFGHFYLMLKMLKMLKICLKSLKTCNMILRLTLLIVIKI